MRHAQLRAFHQVALSGGFSAAARALGLTQPALSEQVRALERDHDVLLFARDGRRVTLTEAGRRLFRLTERYFAAQDAIADHLAQARAAPAGHLRLMVDSAHHVTDLLAGFRRRHPGISLSLSTGNSAAVLAALRAWTADIGVIGSLEPGRDMQVLALGASPIVAFAARGMLPAGGALSLADLARLPLVLREKGSRTRATLEAAARAHGLHLTPVIEAEGREAVREIVASGAGVGVVSRAEFGHDPRLECRPLADVTLEMHESLIHLRARADVRAIRAFISHARRHLGVPDAP